MGPQLWSEGHMEAKLHLQAMSGPVYYTRSSLLGLLGEPEAKIGMRVREWDHLGALTMLGLLRVTGSHWTGGWILGVAARDMQRCKGQEMYHR